MDALENFPIVSECYDRWLELQNQVDSYYKDERRARLRLSEQKEFRAIKNAVIAAADQINAGTLTFEDERMRDEPDEFPQASSVYHRLRETINDAEVLRLSLRHTPELVWEEDHSITYGARILDILSKLDIPEDDEPADDEPEEDYDAPSDEDEELK